jgi:hypothetical protein
VTVAENITEDGRRPGPDVSGQNVAIPPMPPPQRVSGE